ncbi:MAG: hypothetical protein ACE5NA_10660 [Nitrospiraceae bacterium]
MIKQRGITLIEVIVVGAYLSIVVSAAAYGGKTHGALGILVGLAAGAGIPIAVYGLRSWRPAATLYDRGLLLLPFLVVGAHLLRPEVFLLRLAAVAAVLVVGDFLFQGLYTWITSTGGADGFTLHFGWFVFVVVVGTVLAFWWGWLSTAVVLLLDGAWHGVAGLLDRKSIEGLPPGEE